MKKRKTTNLRSIAMAAAMALPLMSGAQNPIVQTWYTSDPAPMVDGNRLYVYTGHDEDGADFFWMYEWRAYSTDDMVNWTDHGSLMSLDKRHTDRTLEIHGTDNAARRHQVVHQPLRCGRL